MDPRPAIVGFARHPNAGNIVMILMLALGIFGAINLTTRFWPPVAIDTIEVTIAWPGASAEDVNDNILEAVEPALRVLDGVTRIRSYAREGSAFVSVEFEAGTDMTEALGDVEQAVAALRTLPDDSERPLVAADTLRDPVAKIAVSGPFSEAALQVHARRIRDDLLARGLDRVTLGGVREREIVVDAREHDLLRLGLTTADVAEAIRGATQDRPSGVLDGVVDRQIRVLAAEETPEAIAAIVLKSAAGADPITVGDVATVRTGFARGSVQGLRAGDPAIEITVERAQQADALRSDALVKDYLAEVGPTLPATLTVELYDVQTEMLWERIAILVSSGWQGLAVVLVVLFIFLDARIAFWVAMGIPVAFAGTLAVMLASGQSINMISLFALIMMLGVIVDDAIVVGEHADTLAKRGVPRDEAAIRGATEMFVPVLASSVTTMASLAPIFLMRGTMGQMMEALPLVGLAIITASIIECFLVLPAHLAHAWGRPSGLRLGRFLRLTLIAGLGAAAIGVLLRTALGADPAELTALFDVPASLVAVVLILAGLALASLVERRIAGRSARPAWTPHQAFRAAFDRRFDGFRDGPYTAFVRAAYRFRYTTLAVGLGAVLVVVWGLYLGSGRVPFVFFTQPEAETITARVEFHPGTPRETVISGVAAVEAALAGAERDIAPAREVLVRDVYALIGRSGRDRGDNLATIQVQLAAAEERTVRTPDVVRAWRNALPEIPGVQRVAIEERRGGLPGRDLDLKLSDAPPAALKAAAADVIAILSTWEGVSAVADDLPYGKPELALRLTPRGEALGFTLESVGAQLRGAFEGEVARRLAVGDEEIPIRVRQRRGNEAVALDELFLRSPRGPFVPLAEVVEVEERNTFSAIIRRDGAVSIGVTADVDAGVTTPEVVTERIRQELLPLVEASHGVRGEFSGRDEDRRRSFEDLRQGTYLALCVIYLVLALVFGSYWRPVVIMLIIPFGAVGAILGHHVLGMALTIVSFVGLLGLAGILVNDSIILVERFDQRLARGESVSEAAVGASADRLRAVLLTSLTTMGGLGPLLFETSISAAFLQPMAVTIVFGLGLATLVVLVLVPALLGIAFDIGRLVRLGLGGAPARA
jgi:multidrug efflux pump subunit AcrB